MAYFFDFDDAIRILFFDYGFALTLENFCTGLKKNICVKVPDVSSKQNSIPSNSITPPALNVSQKESSITSSVSNKRFLVGEVVVFTAKLKSGQTS